MAALASEYFPCLETYQIQASTVNKRKFLSTSGPFRKSVKNNFQRKVKSCFSYRYDYAYVLKVLFSSLIRERTGQMF